MRGGQAPAELLSGVRVGIVCSYRHPLWLLQQPEVIEVNDKGEIPITIILLMLGGLEWT